MPHLLITGSALPARAIQCLVNRGLPINLDPMIPHFRADARSGMGGEDDVGGLVWEVAVNAFASQRASAREETTALNFVTREATRREIFDVALWDVNVVTCRTCHI